MKLISILLTPSFGLHSTLLRVLVSLSLLGCLEAKAQTPPTFATLDAKVDALQNLVESLQKQLAQSQETNTAQAAAIAALQKQVNQIATNPALAIGPFVTVNPNAKNGVSPSINFHGADVRIEQLQGSNP
jgi:membrane protein insertase Oxa1/YidC/SpoIIIJ